MNYDLVCYGTYKENNLRCDNCPDKDFCINKTEVNRGKEKDETK